MEHTFYYSIVRQRMSEGAAIQSRHRQSKLCQCRTVSRCDLYNDGFLPAPWLAPFSLLFDILFCRVWLADGWHIGMSRKGTCILSYQFPYFDDRIGQAQRRVVLDCAGFKPPRETASSVRQNLRSIRRSASISLLNPWQISTMLIHRWVLSYPDAFGVGKTRASPVYKRTSEMPCRLSPQVGILNGKARKMPSVQQLTSDSICFRVNMLEGIAHRDYNEANRQYFMVRFQPVKKRNREANFHSKWGTLIGPNAFHQYRRTLPRWSVMWNSGQGLFLLSKRRAASNHIDYWSPSLR